ncbi:MAG TPA: hypothetical protein VFA68_04190 [Terriglobales bacterium]|nr:hypothetical protein [Terriglobales bacterium]
MPFFCRRLTSRRFQIGWNFQRALFLPETCYIVRVNGTILRERRTGLLLYGALVGFVYGLGVRIGFTSPATSKSFAVMSLSFLFLMPFAMGFLTVYFVERRRPQPTWIWLVLPLLPVFAGLVTTLVALWEGMICILMFAPIGIGLGVIGGLLGGLLGRRLGSQRFSNLALMCVAVLPLVVSPWEQGVLNRREIRTVTSSVEIHASPSVIWKNIERVPAIKAAELPESWSHRIGFPNPVEATLSFAGDGGVRHASFEGGVLFIENIDVWEPERCLAFSIHAQTAQIPRTTLDEHVAVGGPFFDVLRGEYRLETLSDGMVRLHLASQHRVSTDFNWYAHLWTDAVMQDLQRRILYVVKNRSERAASPLK